MLQPKGRGQDSTRSLSDDTVAGLKEHGLMAPNELTGLGQVQGDLDGFGDQAFRSLGILARALHVKNAELEPALLAIVSTAVTTLSSAQHAGLITVSHGRLIPQATTSRPPELLDQLQQKLG